MITDKALERLTFATTRPRADGSSGVPRAVVQLSDLTALLLAYHEELERKHVQDETLRAIQSAYMTPREVGRGVLLLQDAFDNAVRTGDPE